MLRRFFLYVMVSPWIGHDGFGTATDVVRGFDYDRDLIASVLVSPFVQTIGMPSYSVGVGATDG